jgi:hypothetical protein
MKINAVSRKLSTDLLDSRFSSGAIDSWIDLAADQIGGVSWRHVGWTSEDPKINNAGICDIASDKRAPVAEVLVNCMDSLIDLAHLINGLHAPSPHAAVASWPQFASERENWREGRISLDVRDGSETKRPTLDVRDLGRGQHPENFRHTFLSLHSSTKLSSPHLCGKFGMGMKSAFKFCERFVIISRPHAASLYGESGEVGLAVVKKNFPTGDKAPHYEYLCDSRGQIIRLDLSEDAFPHGTLARLSDYDLAGYEGSIASQNKSLWLMLNSFMIDPPITFKVNDRRGSGKKRNVTIKGLLHSLRKPRTANSHEDSFSIKVPFGGMESEVVVHYFVLHPKESPHDASGTKVKAEQAITFSHNGQRHGAEPRQTLKSRFGLGAIRNRLAVVVDTSKLHPPACADLYSSDRVKFNHQSEVYEAIMKAMKAHFDADEELQALDEEATKQSRTDKSANTESVEKAMSDFLVGLLGKKGTMRKVGVGVAKGGGKRTPRNRDDSKLPLLPTRVVIDNSPFIVPKGRFAYLTLDIDAKNGYVQPGDGKVTVSFKDDIASVRSAGILIGGKLRLIVDIPDSSAKGNSQFEVKLDDAPNGIHLSAVGTMRITDPKVGKSGSGNKKNSGDGEGAAGPNVVVNWITKEEWGSPEWTENYPGECSPLRSGDVCFILNLDFKYIQNLRESLHKTKDGNFVSKQNKYADILCRALAYQHFNNMTPEASFATAIAESTFKGVSQEDDHDEEVVAKPKRGRPARKASA